MKKIAKKKIESWRFSEKKFIFTFRHCGFKPRMAVEISFTKIPIENDYNDEIF